MPRHSGDDGLFHGGCKRGPGFYERRSVGLGEGEGRHFFYVGTGGEGFLGASQDDGADLGGFVVCKEGGVKFVYERRGEGVEGFGAVKRYWKLLDGLKRERMGMGWEENGRGRSTLPNSWSWL